jgi:hypothetical protein
MNPRVLTSAPNGILLRGAAARWNTGVVRYCGAASAHNDLPGVLYSPLQPQVNGEASPLGGVGSPVADG